MRGRLLLQGLDQLAQRSLLLLPQFTPGLVTRLLLGAKALALIVEQLLGRSPEPLQRAPELLRPLVEVSASRLGLLAELVQFGRELAKLLLQNFELRVERGIELTQTLRGRALKTATDWRLMEPKAGRNSRCRSRVRGAAGVQAPRKRRIVSLQRRVCQCVVPGAISHRFVAAQSMATAAT
jgi:hypothetical protein